MDAQLPRPGCRGEGLGLPTGQGSLFSLKQGGRGRTGCGGAEGDWEEGRKCKYLNGKIKNKNAKKERQGYTRLLSRNNGREKLLNSSMTMASFGGSGTRMKDD